MAVIPKKYVKKPIVVHAVEVTEDNFEAAAKWAKSKAYHVGTPQAFIKVRTRDGVKSANVGDMLVKTGEKEFSPMTKKLFDILYDEEK